MICEPAAKSAAKIAWTGKRRSLSSASMSSIVALLRNGWVFFLMVALMLAIKEEFPFSHFPMYSVLPDSTNCLQLVDAEGKIVPIWEVFGGSISVLKKQVNHELSLVRKEKALSRRDDVPPEVMGPIGSKVLKWLLVHFPCKDPARKGQVVKLQEITFKLENGRVERTVKTLAEDRM